MEPPEGWYVDEYGQFQTKPVWYNFFTYKARHKWATYGLITSLIGSYMWSKLQRRPLYANLPYKVFAAAATTTLLYFYGKYWTERKFVLRDATISHYMSLHPEDFENIKTTGRKYREILLPWVPYRAFETTVPLLSGIKPYFPKDPTIPPADPEADADRDSDK